jgi:Integrase core domain
MIRQKAWAARQVESAILSYLSRDETLKEKQLRLPKSPRTIQRNMPRKWTHRPSSPHFYRSDRTSPSDASLGNSISKTPPADAARSTRQKATGGGNAGVSSTKAPQSCWLTMCAPILQPRRRLSAVAQTFGSTWLTFLHYAGPRHPVGRLSAQGSDFPAALVRFCQSLAVTVLICDPHHPQQNGFVERYHRTLSQECLRLHRPKTLDEVRQVPEAVAAHSTWQRPLKAGQLWQSASAGRLSQSALSASCC